MSSKPLNIIPVSMHGKEANFNLRVDRLAVHSNGRTSTIKVISFAAPHTTAKAACAALNSNAGVSFDMSYEYCMSLQNDHGFAYQDARQMRRCELGYKTYRHRLQHDWMHIVAISRDDRIMPELSEPSLWRMLKSDRFTTPVIRDWLPYLKSVLTKPDENGDTYLAKLPSFNCSAHLMLALDIELDKFVSHGLKNHRIQIKGN